MFLLTFFLFNVDIFVSYSLHHKSGDEIVFRITNWNLFYWGVGNGGQWFKTKLQVQIKTWEVCCVNVSSWFLWSLNGICAFFEASMSAFFFVNKIFDHLRFDFVCSLGQSAIALTHCPSLISLISIIVSIINMLCICCVCMCVFNKGKNNFVIGHLRYFFQMCNQKWTDLFYKHRGYISFKKNIQIN